MIARIRSYGLTFVIEAHGFVESKAPDDFETACELLEETLNRLSENEVRAIHASCVIDEATGCPHFDEMFERLDAMARDAKNEACENWVRPEGAWLSVSAESHRLIYREGDYVRPEQIAGLADNATHINFTGV